jgi:uncharacterized membrane protein
MKKYQETQLRSIGKVISWRVLLTTSHIVNTFIITGSIVAGLKVAGLAAVINSFLFWAHERIWNMAEWNRQAHDKLNFSEGQPRSIAKIITWRILITASNFFIPWFVTGSLGSAALFAGLATAVNMFLFWGHERVWNWVRWGKTTAPDDRSDAVPV